MIQLVAAIPCFFNICFGFLVMGSVTFCNESFILSLMVGLVKQIWVAIKGYKFLVKTVESRILIKQLCFIPYKAYFRYYFLNRTIEHYKFVPACRSILLIETRGLSQGAGHARINSFLLKQRMQNKCVLNIMHKNKIYVFNCSFI